jgi:hypothetical protein
MVVKLTLYVLVCFVLSLNPIYSQKVEETSSTENNFSSKNEKTEYKRKGKLYIFWGYNRSAYTNSDIHLKGNNHDFTIKNVKGSDSPTTTFGTYVNPASMTVPQYDWRVGYHITDNYSISFGHAHMKYEIENQYVEMSGSIYDGELAGEYNNTKVRVGEGNNHDETGHSNGSLEDEFPDGIVPQLEHCDGLNNFTFEFARKDNLWITKNGKHSLTFEVSVGLGGTVTDTEANVLGVTDPSHGNGDEHAHETGPDEHGGGWGGFHLAGYTTSLSTSIQMEFFNHFFIQARLKGGYVNLLHFITTYDGGRGSQQLGFVEGVIAVGYTFQLSK